MGRCRRAWTGQASRKKRSNLEARPRRRCQATPNSARLNHPAAARAAACARSAAGRAGRRRRARSGRTRTAPPRCPGVGSAAHGSPASRHHGRSRPRRRSGTMAPGGGAAASTMAGKRSAHSMAVARERRGFALSIPSNKKVISAMLDLVDPELTGRRQGEGW